MKRLAAQDEAAAWIHLDADTLSQRFPAILAFWWDAEGRVWVETDETLSVETPTGRACPVASEALTALLEGGWKRLAQKAPRLTCGCYVVIEYEPVAEAVSCLFARRDDRFTAELRLPAAGVLTEPSLTAVVGALQNHPHNEATFRMALHTLNPSFA
jgi:hypothetical protein